MHIVKSSASGQIFKAILVSLSLVFGVSSVAIAGDEEAEELLEQALELYNEKRTTLSEVYKAVSLLDKAVDEADDEELKYEILVYQSRNYYWIGGEEAGKADKLKYYDLSIKAADRAKGLIDEYADAYYYAAIALGRWAETKGISESLGRKNELFDRIRGAADRETLEGDEGKTIDGYGPDRVLGRMYHKLPRLFGGDHDESVKHLKVAVEKAPTNALNVVYLAETYFSGSRTEKDLGCQLLKDLVKKNPRTLDPKRVPETLEDFEQAKKLIANKCTR